MRGAFNILLPWKVILLFPLVFFFALNQSYALDVTLRWDANTEPDLAGYKFYYDTDSGAPYDPNCLDYAGATYSIDGGNTWNPIICPPPIIVGSGVTEIMFRGLADDNVHFFAVTAYDFDDLESGYSNEEATICISYPQGDSYVNDEPGSPNYGAPYTVRGRADVGAKVTLSDEDGNSWTDYADSLRDWSVDVNFKILYGNDRSVKFTVESEGITAPDVTATYDPTDPASNATAPASGSGTLSITWTAYDATSGLASTELWHKPPRGTWSATGLSQGGTSGTFSYTPSGGLGTYYFATRAVDRASNWEVEPSGEGDCSVVYISESELTGGEGNGGCFITTAAPGLFSGQ